MAELALVRIDARMIHGQVVTQWIKRLSCTRIIMVDDQFSADPFMSKVLVMAAPPGVKFDLISTKQAGEQWQKDQFGSVGPIMVIFKNVVTMYNAYNAGFTFPRLQVGGLGGGSGRVNVHGPITLDETDAKQLKEIEDKGCSIFFQVNPDTGSEEWEPIRQKYFPNI